MEWITAVRTLPYCCYPVILLSYHLHLLVFVCFALVTLLLGMFFCVYCFDHCTPFSYVLNIFSRIVATEAAKGRGRQHRGVSDENPSGP